MVFPVVLSFKVLPHLNLEARVVTWHDLPRSGDKGLYWRSKRQKGKQASAISLVDFIWDGCGYGSIPMKIPFLGEWTSILTQLFLGVHYRGTSVVLTHCHVVLKPHRCQRPALDQGRFLVWKNDITVGYDIGFFLGLLVGLFYLYRSDVFFNRKHLFFRALVLPWFVTGFRDPQVNLQM